MVCHSSMFWLQPIMNAVCMTGQQVVERPGVPERKCSGTASIAERWDLFRQMTPINLCSSFNSQDLNYIPIHFKMPLPGTCYPNVEDSLELFMGFLVTVSLILICCIVLYIYPLLFSVKCSKCIILPPKS